MAVPKADRDPDAPAREMVPADEDALMRELREFPRRFRNVMAVLAVTVVLAVAATVLAVVMFVSGPSSKYVAAARAEAAVSLETAKKEMSAEVGKMRADFEAMKAAQSSAAGASKAAGAVGGLGMAPMDEVVECVHDLTSHGASPEDAMRACGG